MTEDFERFITDEAVQASCDAAAVFGFAVSDDAMRIALAAAAPFIRQAVLEEAEEWLRGQSHVYADGFTAHFLAAESAGSGLPVPAPLRCDGQTWGPDSQGARCNNVDERDCGWRSTAGATTLAEFDALHAEHLAHSRGAADTPGGQRNEPLNNAPAALGGAE